MTTDELNAIVQAVMTELEKAGVDFDFKAETPQADDLVYVMRGTADRYMGITVKWQNLLDIIVQKATEAKNEAVSAKDIALQTLATIQSIESNISTMKASVETTKSQVETMKASVEASESNVTQMKSDVTNLKAQTQTIVDNAKEEVTGLLNTKVNYSDSLSYEEIMASTDLTGKVASASALKYLKPQVNSKTLRFTSSTTLSYIEGAYITIPANCIFGITARLKYYNAMPLAVMLSLNSSGTHIDVSSYIDHSDNNDMLGCSLSSYTINETTYYVWGKYNASNSNEVVIHYWYIQF